MLVQTQAPLKDKRQLRSWLEPRLPGYRFAQRGGALIVGTGAATGVIVKPSGAGVAKLPWASPSMLVHILLTLSFFAGILPGAVLFLIVWLNVKNNVKQLRNEVARVLQTGQPAAPPQQASSHAPPQAVAPVQQQGHAPPNQGYAPPQQQGYPQYQAHAQPQQAYPHPQQQAYPHPQQQAYPQHQAYAQAQQHYPHPQQPHPQQPHPQHQAYPQPQQPENGPPQPPPPTPQQGNANKTIMGTGAGKQRP